MGWTMRWCEQPAGEQRAVAAAGEAVGEAVAAILAIEEQRGEYTAVEFHAADRPSCPSAATPEYKAAQQRLDEALLGVRDAARSRLDVVDLDMERAWRAMERLGMVCATDAPAKPPWPQAPASGDRERHAWQLAAHQTFTALDEGMDLPPGTPVGMTALIRRFHQERRAVESAHGHDACGGTPLIASHKLMVPLRWHITPAEVRGTLGAAHAAGIRAVVATGVDPVWWAMWIGWLHDAAAHGGVIVGT